MTLIINSTDSGKAIEEKVKFLGYIGVNTLKEYAIWYAREKTKMELREVG